ncbi:hypothetical protein L3X38_033595 [Prunus dulcis]|uniref:Uncharacterized protein n=1 Tax=Prunus dulcis TaxID=3755 RepID=A0AAD4VHX1_PRUDU|nr:hypothetical protein L3X38_033595 [Prunus dulcis]
MVGCRWVHTLKHKANGSIERARIVAKGQWYACQRKKPRPLINPTTEPSNSSYLVAAFAIGADLIEVGESKDISDRQSHSMSTCATFIRLAKTPQHAISKSWNKAFSIDLCHLGMDLVFQ